MISQTVISSWGGIRKPPFVFTEHGVTMFASVLKSEIAVKASIQIVKAFVSMRHFVQSNSQIFDAYAKFESFIQSAQKEIILIDNYVDLSVLQRLAKKKKGVNVIIYTDSFCQKQLLVCYNKTRDI